MNNSALTVGIIVVSSVIPGCTTTAQSKAPDGLMIEFLQGPSAIDIKDSTPEFGWIVHSSANNDMQSAYRILVAGDKKMLDKDQADMWDSKKAASEAQIETKRQKA